MASTAVVLSTLMWTIVFTGQAHAVRPTSCAERMEGVLTSDRGDRHEVRLRLTVTYPGFGLEGRFRCRPNAGGPCVAKAASVSGLYAGDPDSTRYRVALSRGFGDAYRLLCRLEGTAPFLFGLYLPALEGTYDCDGGTGARDRGTFQLVGVGRGRCS